MTDTIHHPMFPLGADDTPYRKITEEGIGTAHF